jgi:flavin reductase (DIM6/NTAB) family NADH-FMN oxidoreductase RutF/rubredoxin
MDITALFKLSYGVYVIGTKDEERLTGCVVNTVTQVSNSPVIVSVCINRKNYTNQCIKNCKQFSVSILSESVPSNVIGNFGFHSGKDFDKFKSIQHSITSNGMPILNENISAYLDCKVVSSVEVEDYTVFFAEVIDTKSGEGKQMTYDYYYNVVKGKSAPNAPTFVKEKEIGTDENVKNNTFSTKWECSICGYIYDNPDVPFEELPDGWKCPFCETGKEMFRKID